ncbi:hypothetical protein TNCV_4400381 [Trichonephila clavipes]|nr:hypothetical protein TNCV_4400381 [Trichonephila clavipes]
MSYEVQPQRILHQTPAVGEDILQFSKLIFAENGRGVSSFCLPLYKRCFLPSLEAAVAEWYRYRIVACLVTSSSPIPLKTCRVQQRCTLNLSRAETFSNWK